MILSVSGIIDSILNVGIADHTRAPVERVDSFRYLGVYHGPLTSTPRRRSAFLQNSDARSLSPTTPETIPTGNIMSWLGNSRWQLSALQDTYARRMQDEGREDQKRIHPDNRLFSLPWSGRCAACEDQTREDKEEFLPLGQSGPESVTPQRTSRIIYDS